MGLSNWFFKPHSCLTLCAARGDGSLRRKKRGPGAGPCSSFTSFMPSSAAVTALSLQAVPCMAKARQKAQAACAVGQPHMQLVPRAVRSSRAVSAGGRQRRGCSEGRKRCSVKRTAPPPPNLLSELQVLGMLTA